MHVNRTRIILIVMIVATVVLGGAAIFIGWRLQTQINTKSFAGQCKEECNNGCNSDDTECHNYCNSLPACGSGSGDGGGQSQCGLPGDECESFCCNGTTPIGCNQTKYCGAVNGGPTSCSGTNIGKPKSVNGDCSGNGGGGGTGGTGGTTIATCTAAKGCFNTSTNVCIANGDTWCSGGQDGGTPYGTSKCNNGVVQDLGDNYTGAGACKPGFCPTGSCLDRNNAPGNTTFNQCIAAGSANCNSSASTGNTCQICDCTDTGALDYQGRECRRNCTGYNRACNSVIPACGQLDFPPNGAQNIVIATGCTTTTSSSSTSSITTQNTCYKCTDAEDDGNACQTRTTTGTCASLGAGWTSNSLCETGATGGSCTSAIQAKVRGRVYCQDTNGPLIPIPNTVVAITKGSTTVNATTDADGFYVSSNIGLPSSGDKVAVDIGSLPTTFNNGLNTSQLASKSAINCASTSLLPGCSTGVASNYYCNSVSTKASYANCKITTPGDTTFGHSGFDFKYTNCTATISSCGDSVVDSGEACDPVGTVGQCSNGGKCQTGCACPTCNSKCTTNDDCPDGLVCSSNSCRNPSNKSAVDCKAGTTSVPSTGLLDSNYGLIFASFVLMILGLLTVRNQGAVTLMTNVAISLFGTNILRYVDPAGAKRYYEKNILNKQKHETK